jgi:hypothetical protein
MGWLMAGSGVVLPVLFEGGGVEVLQAVTNAMSTTISNLLMGSPAQVRGLFWASYWA